MLMEELSFFKFCGGEISQLLLNVLDYWDWIAYFWNIALWSKEASKLKASNSLIASSSYLNQGWLNASYGLGLFCLSGLNI
jgi:hypothetical protein